MNELKELIPVTKDMPCKKNIATLRFSSYWTIIWYHMHQNIAKTQEAMVLGLEGNQLMNKKWQVCIKLTLGWNEPVIYHSYRWFHPKNADQQANGEISWMPSFKGRLWKVPLGTPHSVAVKTRLLRLKTFHCLASSVTGLTESMFVFIGIETPSWYYYRPAGGIGDTVKDLTNILYMEHKRPETDMRIFSVNPKRERWKPSSTLHGWQLCYRSESSAPPQTSARIAPPRKSNSYIGHLAAKNSTCRSCNYWPFHAFEDLQKKRGKQMVIDHGRE